MSTQTLRGTLNDCAVTADGTDMVLTITAGNVLFDNVAAAVAGGTVTIGAADSNQDRYDAVCVGSTGALSVVQGTVGVTGFDDPLGTAQSKVILAIVRVVAASTAITSSMLSDNRQYALLAQPSQTFAYTFLSGAQSAVDPGAGKCGFDSGTLWPGPRGGRHFRPPFSVVADHPPRSV